MVRKRKRKTKQKNAKSKHKKSTHEIAMQNLTCGSIWRVKTADEEVNKTGKTVLSGWKRCQVFFFYIFCPVQQFQPPICYTQRSVSSLAVCPVQRFYFILS